MEAQLKVMLVSYSPEPEKTISAAARLCYSPADAEDILSKVGDNDQQDFLGKLTAVGHLSPVEHASFTFVVKAYPVLALISLSVIASHHTVNSHNGM